jgi:hypothetical protein
MDRRRLLMVVATLVGVPLIGFIMIGSASPMVAGLAVILLVAVLGAAFGRRPGGDVGWLRTPTVHAAAPTEPAGTPARGSVARSLAPVEAAQLFFNPWFIVGLGFWVLIILMFGVLFTDDLEPTWWGLASLFPLLAHPLCGCTVVAAHRGITRSRRDGAEELFSTCPAGWPARTRGHLLTLWVPVAASAVLGAVMLVLIVTGSSNVYGAIDDQVMVDAIVALLLPAGAAGLGVALGRWLPSVIAPILAVVGVMAIDAQIGAAGGRSWDNFRWLATFIPSTTAERIFYDPPGWQRIVWFVGLIALVMAVALLRGEHSRRVPVALAASMVVVTFGAALVARPLPPAEAQAVADMINEPSPHQTCSPAGQRVNVCVYRGLGKGGQEMAAELSPVAAAITFADLDHATFRHSFDAEPADLQPEVGARVRAIDQGPDTLRLRFHLTEEAREAARLRLAAWATGLPTEPVDDEVGTVVAGQSRGVVALWLATRGMSVDRANRMLFADTQRAEAGTDGNGPGDIWPGRCQDEGPVLLWAVQDVRAARQLVAADQAPVAAQVQANWDRWMDPASTTDELLAALDLEPEGRTDLVDSFSRGCY